MLSHRLACNTDVYSLLSDNNHSGFRGNVKNVLLACVAGLCITQCNISYSFFLCPLQFKERGTNWACNFIKERIAWSKRSCAITLCEAEWGKTTRWASVPFYVCSRTCDISQLVLTHSSSVHLVIHFLPQALSKTGSRLRRTDQTSCSQATLKQLLPEDPKLFQSQSR